MKKLLLAASMLTALALPANANLVLEDAIFADLGATGFGNAPRLLNIQNNGSEAGGTFYSGTPGNPADTLANQLQTQTGFFTGLPPGTVCTSNGTCQNQPQVEVDKSAVYSLSQLVTLTGGGWATGATVGIGLDTNETGANPALTFNSLVLTLTSETTNATISFAGSQPVNIPLALLNLQQGNGNSVFDIGLDAAQQAQYDAFVLANGGLNNIFASLSASFGTGLPGQVCPSAGTLAGFASPGGCFASSDGQESFLAFNQAAVPGPIVGAGLPGLVLGALGLLGFNRNRRRRQAA
jgi:hypothetical protein